MRILRSLAAGPAALAAISLSSLWLCSCPKPRDPIFGDWDVKPRLVCEGEPVKFEYFVSPNALPDLEGLRISPEVGALDPAQNEKVHVPLGTQTYVIEAKYKGSWYSTPEIPPRTVTVIRECDPVQHPEFCHAESAETPGKSTGEKGPNEPPCEWVIEYPPGSVSSSLRVAAIRNPNGFDVFVRSQTHGKLVTPIPIGGEWKFVTAAKDDSLPLEGVWRVGPAHGEADPRFQKAASDQSLMNCIGLPVELTFVVTCGGARAEP